MKNKDGKYVAQKLMPVTGAPLEGTGDTMEKARLDLKMKVQAYREQMLMGTYLVPTGDVRPSPGMTFFQTDAGHVTLRPDPDRKVEIMARPEVAVFIQGGRKANLLK